MKRTGKRTKNRKNKLLSDKGWLNKHKDRDLNKDK